MKVCAGKISSRYGDRTHPVTGEKDTYHTGVDIAAPVGTPVYSPTDGTAVLVETGPIGGRQIHVRNGTAEYHFLHLSEQLIKRGEHVRRGALIGRVGATGRVTGPHLHYAVKINGQYVNPEPLIEFQP
jgi:murein DD-endopeptidase MepM/ murein hydrolase activator NlpD